MSSVQNSGFGIDTSSIRNQMANPHNPMAYDSKFSSVLNGMAMAANVAGPVTVESLTQAGHGKAGAITSTAVMGAMGNSGSSYMSWGGAGTPVSKNLGMPGTAPGYPGSGAVGGASGYGSGMQSSADFDGQIDQMFNNNMVFLAMQQKVQYVSQTSQMMSNISKTDSDAKLASIRNMRAS